MLENISVEFGPLVPAVFIERPNRFLVRCRLAETEELVEAHLADPGRLTELLVPEARLFLRFEPNPRRKTRWSVVLVLAHDNKTLVSVQSTLVNELAGNALKARAIPELPGWKLTRSEFSYGGSRWDFLLENSSGDNLLLEVKSCSLVQNGVAMFPDAVTERGRRHVQSLAKLKKSGEFKTAVLFVVQRNDAEVFKPAYHIDPAFSDALKEAYDQGVQILARRCGVSMDAISLGRTLPVDFL